jgi:hypothetical protein
LFPDLESAVARGEYPSFETAYEANKDLIESTLQDPRKSEQFAGDYLKVARERFPDDEARAIAAYNVGMTGAEKLQDPAAFPYVQGVGGFIESPAERVQAPSIPGISAAQASTATPSALTLPGANKETANPQERWEFLSRRPAGGLDAEERAELFDLTKQFGRYQVPSKTEGLGSPELNQFLQENVLDPFQENIGAPIEGFIERAGEGISGFLEDPVGATMEATVSPENFAKFQERRAAEQIKRAEEQGDATRRPGGPSGMTADAEARRQAEEQRARDQEAALYDQAQAPETETTEEEPKSALDRYMDMIERQRESAEKQAEMDRYLALAKAGATLASSTAPTFLGAVGEATGTGIEALQGARGPISDIEEAERDFMKALAVSEVSGESKSATRQLDFLRLAKDYDKMIADFRENVIGEPTPEQLVQLSQLEQQRDMYRVGAGLPPMATTGGTSLVQDILAGVLAEQNKRKEEPQK